MNSSNPGPISGPTTPNNNFPVTAPLHDQERKGDVGLGSQSDFIPSDENIDPSVVTLDPTVPELDAAYRKTFLQITPPAIPKKEILAQLEPFSRTVTADLSESLILSEFLNAEANVQASADILNVIEKAMEEGSKMKKLYGQTGINAAVTNDTSPTGSQGVHEQDALLHSLGNIAETALGTASSSHGIGSHLPKNNSIEPTGASGPDHGPVSQANKLFSAMNAINTLILASTNGAQNGGLTLIATPHPIAGALALNTLKKESSSQGGSYNSYDPESEQISNELLNAEEENLFENANTLNRMMERDTDNLIKLQDTMQHSLNTLKGLISNPSFAIAIAA
ncbi:MAG: hypothetical protein K2W99_06480 [Chthoniobacterales bacterium]|nr:hypothetical protein [Chthoniobacterales bacterium]